MKTQEDSFDKRLLRTDARVHAFLRRFARFKLLLRTCPNISQFAAALHLTRRRNQLGLQSFKVCLGPSFLREEFSGLDIVKNCKGLPRLNTITNLRPHFYNPSMRKGSDDTNPAIDGLNGPVVRRY